LGGVAFVERLDRALGVALFEGARGLRGADLLLSQILRDLLKETVWVVLLCVHFS